MSDPGNPAPHVTRRDLLGRCLRGGALLGLGAVGAAAAMRGQRKASVDGLVWQIDPYKCTWCGKCETACVLAPSAVKCFRDHKMCGYCEICTGFQAPVRLADDEAAENQICPTQAIDRIHKESVYYEYQVDTAKCIGCAKCCEGCTTFGNGSMYLQVYHDRCLNCAVCTIARACPAQAFVRVPASDPYLIKSRHKAAAKPPTPVNG